MNWQQQQKFFWVNVSLMLLIVNIFISGHFDGMWEMFFMFVVLRHP